jgi:hypothetical protein
MTTRTYHGSCHCGAVRFEADVDLAAGTGKCNCTYCTKSRNWNVLLKPEAFRLVAGAEALADYRFGTMQGHNRFCRTCGVHTHSVGDIPALGGAFVSLQLAALDDADPADLAAAPVRYSDGRNDNWMQAPAITAYL